MRRRVLAGTVLLSLWLTLTTALLCPAGDASQSEEPTQDACQTLLQRSTSQLRRSLESRLAVGFPIGAQLPEGNARLASPSISELDCTQRHVGVTGAYEFRGNLGVMDITRRGTVVLRLHLTPDVAEQQIWLKAPEVMDITFDNPAPWFDGKAIGNWALSLFSKPWCTRLDDGHPC